MYFSIKGISVSALLSSLSRGTQDDLFSPFLSPEHPRLVRQPPAIVLAPHCERLVNLCHDGGTSHWLLILEPISSCLRAENSSSTHVAFDIFKRDDRFMIPQFLDLWFTKFTILDGGECASRGGGGAIARGVGAAPDTFRSRGFFPAPAIPQVSSHNVYF